MTENCYCGSGLQPIRRYFREILSHVWVRGLLATSVEPLWHLYRIPQDFGSVEKLYCFVSLFRRGQTYLNSQEVIWTATTVAKLKIDALVPSVERSQQTVQQRKPKQPRSDISQRSFALKNNQAERARGLDSWWSPAGGQVMTWLWPEGIGSCSQKAFKENCVELLLLLSQLSFFNKMGWFHLRSKRLSKSFCTSVSLRLGLLGVTCLWIVAPLFS